MVYSKGLSSSFTSNWNQTRNRSEKYYEYQICNLSRAVLITKSPTTLESPKDKAIPIDAPAIFEI
jgi:hypothetical protein